MLRETPALAADGQPYRVITLRNANGVVVTLMDWGATLLSARIPMKDGSVREALLGCASPEQYTEQAAFLGASIGRYANRIANSRYTLDGKTVELAPSQGQHQLHGGPEGFDKRRWAIASQNPTEAVFRAIRASFRQRRPIASPRIIVFRLSTAQASIKPVR